MATASTTKETVNKAGSLTSFTDTSSGNVYYRGRLPFSFSIPSDLGNVTYSVLVTPGTVRADINKTVVIEPPGGPELTNCNLHTFIEGDSSTEESCDCRVASLGSPSGRLQWVADDVVLASGEYGVTQLVFPYDKLTRTHDGTTVRCRVDWVVKRETISFTPRMIYGPNTAEIFVHNPTIPNDSANMTLLCEPDDVSPLSRVITTWGGLCQGQQGRMCTLTPPFERYDGKEVTCTVTNQKIAGKQVTAKWIVKADDKGEQTKTDATHNTDDMDKAMTFSEGVGIGVAVMLIVVLSVVGVMLVVLWRRRLLPACLCCVPTYDTPSKKRQKEEEEQRTYTDLSLYEPVGEMARSSTGPGNTSRTAGVETRENVYANDAA
ncbi:uncharacterized protein [Littorina saxatilis]|uniref:uncharacterized protein n=1 Tax=Littorina saxatilis TaxID=31220 RepID=UPI0038B54079